MRNERADQVLIDKEYPGHEGTIKGIVIQLFRKDNKKEPHISFGNVGKTSLVHKTALAAFRGELKPHIVVKATEILELLYKSPNKKGWRSRSKAK